MRLDMLTIAAVGAALGLAACTEPPPPATAAAPAPAQQTGSQQQVQPQGGAVFQGTGPGVTAYTGSQRGSNSTLGTTFQVPPNPPPVTAYTGSQRGSNSPLGFQRTPTGSVPVIQPSPSSPSSVQ